MRSRIHLQALSFLSILVLLMVGSVSVGQNREKFVISAKAGGINAVTGQASVHGKGETEWQQLMITDDLRPGDRVRTAMDGRVEILLNPGSYLRLGSNSEVELTDNSLANLELRLLRGTAVVEASGVEETQIVINISTPHAKMAIDRQGLYRLSVVPNDLTELIIRKGRVILGDSQTKIKSGNKVVFSATVVSVAKLTSQEKKAEKEIAIQQWSKERAEFLAKANRRIDNRMLTSAFASMNSGFFSIGYGSAGLWFYNTRSSCYTFLPYRYGSSYSPYGNSYPTTIYGGGPRTGAYSGMPSGGLPGSSPGGTSTGSISPTSPGSSMPVRPSPTVAPSTDTSFRPTRNDMRTDPSRPQP